MATTTFETVILGMRNNTGIEVPEANLAELGAGKRPPVVVEVNGYTYRSTPGVMGGRILIPFAKAHREAAGLGAGDHVIVTLTLEEGPREVEVPSELGRALQEAGLTERFEQRSYTQRKEAALQVAEAKTEETRQRRIAKVLDGLH
ncbi:MAG: YdeI/OmpD-associated family protein [Actinomycetes bacterium]